MNIKALFICAALICMVTISCKHSIDAKMLVGKWNYVKVENPYSPDPPDTVSATELAQKAPYIRLSENGVLLMMWDHKVLSHGTYKLVDGNISYTEQLPDGKTRTFPFWIKELTDKQITKEAMHGIPEKDAFPDQEALLRFIHAPGFFRTVPVIPGAIEALQRLMLNFNVYIVSAAMEFPLSLYEKQQWLAEHFPFISWHNIVFCGDKSLIHTDYLVDDHPKNLDFCRGKAIMFTAGHNRNHTQYTRVHNWTEAVTLLESELRK
jgi:5'(3')-deoxyribonucleotidase